MKTFAALVLLFIIHNSYFILSPHAQLLGVTGANHPELQWQQIETEHFILVYHQGLDSIVRTAAPIAEEVYRVVTTNLQTPLSEKTRIYFSDNDEERNAFAFQDDYIFVWMRGILDDNLFSIRSSGTSKWLRSVITHEFTHIVIAHATYTWVDAVFPSLGVPRWFNEGMARYMEPDGWTNDLDIPLRTAAVSSKLHLGLEDFLGGVILYEGGQSLVRYIAATYGDSALVSILKHREPSLFPYDFETAVKAATNHSLSEIYDEWHKVLNVYYNTQFGQKEDVEDIARKIPTHLAIVGAARLAPDGKRIAILGKRTVDASSKLYILANDTGSEPTLVTDEPGIEPYLSWSPDGKYLLFSKIRFGDHGDLVYDIYRCDAESGDLNRISSNERLEYPDWSPDGSTIVAAQFERSGSDLVLLDANGQHLRHLTTFHDDNVDVYSPRWSPDGKQIAFSIFRKNGMRDVATVDINSHEIHYLTDDSINDRYPIWSPTGDSILFLSFQNGNPDLYAMPSASPMMHGVSARSQLRELTDVASNVLACDWPKGKDSILVTSFTSRNSVQLFWLRADRSADPTQILPLASKYSSWRTVHWPLITGTPDTLPQAFITGPYDYNSLGHIRPLFILPFAATDLTHAGAPGTQWGAFTLLSDEMQKHLIEAYMLYGDVSNKLSYAIEYENNQLLPNLFFGAADAINFRDVLQDIPYYEHDRSFNVGANFTFHTPNSTVDIHNLFVGAKWNDLTPWNPSQFANVDSNERPIAARLLIIGGVYSYLSDLFQFGLIANHSDKALGSDLTRTQLRTAIHKEFAFDEDENFELAFIARGAANFGDELPQDALGFYKYDDFDGGFNLTTLEERDRLPGIRRYYYGNRLLSGAIEFREADNVLSAFVPILKTFNPQLVEFFDLGSTWYANAPTNNPDVTITQLAGTEWLKTAGVALRSELGFEFDLEGGVGWELVRNSSADFFIRISELF
jgi:hypothetical protein